MVFFYHVESTKAVVLWQEKSVITLLVKTSYAFRKSGSRHCVHIRSYPSPI